jgi:glutamate racemase
MSSSDNILMIDSSIGGLAVALALVRRGIAVEVDLQTTTICGQRL